MVLKKISILIFYYFITINNALCDQTLKSGIKLIGSDQTKVEIRKGNQHIVDVCKCPTPPRGRAGSMGFPGEPGPIGIKGDKGQPGLKSIINGLPGPAGMKGQMGDIGSIGPERPSGPKGVVGLKGFQGPQGISGDIGVKGFSGNSGQTGLQGPIGSIGDPGPIGLTGPQGNGNAADEILITPDLFVEPDVDYEEFRIEDKKSANKFISVGYNDYDAEEDKSLEDFLKNLRSALKQTKRKNQAVRSNKNLTRFKINGNKGSGSSVWHSNGKERFYKLIELDSNKNTNNKMRTFPNL